MSDASEKSDIDSDGPAIGSNASSSDSSDSSSSSSSSSSNNSKRSKKSMTASVRSARSNLSKRSQKSNKSDKSGRSGRSGKSGRSNRSKTLLPVKPNAPGPVDENNAQELRETFGENRNKQNVENNKVNLNARANNSVLRSGGAYLPPAKARLLQQQMLDKSSEAYQRLAWDALKKSINGLVNKVNIGNISIIVRELFQENLVRGRGILAKSIMNAQQFSPTFTQVYAALVAVLNTRLPQTGELLCKRLIVRFRKTFKRQDKQGAMLAVKFLGQLVNQNVCHEIIALEILSLLVGVQNYKLPFNENLVFTPKRIFFITNPASHCSKKTPPPTPSK